MSSEKGRLPARDARAKASGPGDAELPPNQQLVASHRWPLVGERAPREDPSPWTVRVTGQVSRETTVTLDELRALPQVDRLVDIHCVTRWSRPQMQIVGVPLSVLLDRAGVSGNARYVSFVARSARDHSTSLSLEYLRSVESIVALQADGRPLTIEHGGPVRMVVPGKYFYKSIKWLERIELLESDRLGFWEADIGYHNEADPWKEQRFVAANISRKLAGELIAARDFTGRDLRSIDCSARNLDGLKAAGAALRNADFRRASLRGADFSNANLSGARFDEADLTDAKFVGADVEGTEFRAAQLTNADFWGASLFGTSFCEADSAGHVKRPAVLNGTVFDSETLEALTAAQRRFVDESIL